MKIKRAAIILLLCFLGCRDNPYSLPISAKEENFVFSGIVELGTPLSGADIAAHKFAGLIKGDEIAKAISNQDGSFDLKFATTYDGPLLLVAKGGLFRDLATGEITALKPRQELSSVITHIKMPEKTNINAWTTLAAARVFADRGFWDKSVVELKDIDRINVDFSHISYFISGKSNNFINIRRQEIFDVEKDSLVGDKSKLALHIAHGGLSELAKQFSAQLENDGIIISVVDLLDALKDDLSDRVFDGRKADGSVAYVGNNHRVSLNSYTMRSHLSGAIFLYLKQLQKAGKLTETDRKVFEMPGQIIDSIARDVHPELFPSSEQPKPLDTEGPKLLIRFANEQKDEFAILEGEVNFKVEAVDDSKIQEIKILEPRIGNKESAIFGPILVNYIPQAMAAARICGKETQLKKQFVDENLSLDNVICACFEARDVFDNISKELMCFQRAIPQAIISFPTNETILSNKNLQDSFLIKAKVSSGLPLRKCSWSIQYEDQNLISGLGKIMDSDCIIEDAVDGSKFENGNYFFVIDAEDIGGRLLGEKESKTMFQVSKEPPPVQVVSPSNKSYLAHDFISISGTMARPELIKEIRASYRSNGANNSTLKGNARAVVLASSNTWTLSIGEKLTPGEYTFELEVKDIYDNEKRLPSINITIDQEAPKINGPLDGVPQNTYAQETINYQQRLISDKHKAQYIITPMEKASVIAWHKTPVIHRWFARIEDAATAPGYIFHVSDDKMLKEVKYKIDKTCVSLKEADKTLFGKDGKYDIRFVRSNINFDLSQKEQKYCLSIWAIDQAGNASNHTIEFIWKMVSSPLSIDMNAARYKAHRREDDISWVGPPVWSLFRVGNPIILRRDLVIGHAIISNPFTAAVSGRLKLKKPLDLNISQHHYYVPENFIDVRYFVYDLAKNELGSEKTLSNGLVNINGGETIIAKFILAKEVAITGIDNPDKNFWQTFSLRLGFAKTGHGQALVDGLLLLTRDGDSGNLSNEYMVPWGEDHDTRRRSAPQVIYH